MIKPMLAENYVESALRFPLIAQPKVDGVRGLNLEGRLIGRSLKEHVNEYATKQFSLPGFIGLDGELFCGPRSNITSVSLCRDTSSALRRIKGEPMIMWMVFDLVNQETISKPYYRRLELLLDMVRDLHYPDIFVVPSFHCDTLEQLAEHNANFLAEGYEGTIIRYPNGPHKEGRSTVLEDGLLRIKGFVDAEARVESLEEGNENQNEATTNELGRTERSTHQENMVPNGKVGAMICSSPSVKGPFRVSAGAMTHPEREYYWQHPEAIVGKLITYKHFPKGVKDKPRFATFKNIRIESDIQS